MGQFLSYRNIRSIKRKKANVLFLDLPLNVRIMIYSQCVMDACTCECQEAHPPFLEQHPIPKIKGIGTLPLLFTNKQIAHEVLHLLYSEFRPLRIDDYSFKPDPSTDTILLFTPLTVSLPQHPALEEHLRQIALFVSYGGPFWSSNTKSGTSSVCGFKPVQKTTKSDSEYDHTLSKNDLETIYLPERRAFLQLAQAPASEIAATLLHYLHRFESIFCLQIVVDIPYDRRHVLTKEMLEELLPFLSLCQEVEVILRFARGNTWDDKPSKALKKAWTEMWKACLATYRYRAMYGLV